MNAADLRPGDWIIVPFGSGTLRAYVVAQQALNRVVELGSPDWAPGGKTEMDYRQLDEGFVYMGHSEPRAWCMPWMHPYRRPTMKVER